MTSTAASPIACLACPYGRAGSIKEPGLARANLWWRGMCVTAHVSMERAAAALHPPPAIKVGRRDLPAN